MNLGVVPRIYLTGALAIEHGDHLLRDTRFPGRQGRTTFVFLALNRHRSVHRDELMGAVWPGDAPAQTDAALDALLSKLRATLKSAGFSPREAGVDAASGVVTLRLPETVWIDVEAAGNALDEAEGALRRGDMASAWSLANVVAVISRRPLLSSVEAPWVEAQRNTLRGWQMRALQCLVAVSASNGEPLLAIQHAAEMIQLDPLREIGYQLLMKMHAAAGDRAAAMLVFAKCRELLRDELGVSPSPQTEAIYLEILRAE